MTNQKKLLKFEEIKKSAEEEYNKVDFVYNPFLCKQIKLNMKGLNHIKGKD